MLLVHTVKDGKEAGRALKKITADPEPENVLREVIPAFEA